MQKTYLSNISLTNYRNFSSKRLSFKNDISVLIGANGSGKTNILEAISLLAPGKGIRGAKLEEIEKYNHPIGWNISANIINDNINYNISSFKAPQNNNRAITINDEKITKQQILTNYLNIVWTTPIYDSIFISDKSLRRKFFDRVICNIFPDHLQNIMRYEHYVKERMKVLQTDYHNEAWLKTIEFSIAELIDKITTSRIDAIRYLNNELDILHNNTHGNYPKSLLFFDGLFENFYIEDDNNRKVYYEQSNGNSQKKQKHR